MTINFLLTVFVATVSVAAQSCNNGDVRLVGGLFLNEGRVEVCINQVWGTVTHDSFSSFDARVVCRQLGYPVDDPGAITTYRCCANYGQGSGPIVLDNVGCSGTESSLLQCSHSSPTSSDSHSEDVGVICPACNPDHGIRLNNGLIPQEGNVEICFSGIWRSVCDSSWDHKDAFVVCRELGYPATAAIAFNNAYFGEHPRPNISSVLCYGNESTLLDCSYTNTSFCSPTNTAGVRCQGDTIPDPPCFSSTIRLTGGKDENEGRVEVCSNGVWGTICGGGYWDSNDTTVVCRQLGYQNPRVFVYQSSSYFGQGNGPILFDDLTCDGIELGLIQCSSSSPNQVHCSHSSDVGVRCEEIVTAVIDACTDGDVRLMDGETAAEGRVEICINSVWGSVCDDRWDVIDAGVVCNQLGFQSANATAYFGAYFGRSAGPYNLDDVRCNGDESTLLKCLQSGPGFHNCIPGKDAGVKCDVSSCQHGEVQLVGGAKPYGGRLEICVIQEWATVCRNSFTSFSMSVPASVVCKQLLGENASAIWYDRGYFGLGSGRLILDDLSCTGLELSIGQCSYIAVTDFNTAGCDHRRDVEIICYVSAGCKNGDVRLVNGKSELEGTVEMCIDGAWGTVVGSLLSFQTARLICEQLGYPSEWAIPLTSSFFDRGEAPVLVYGIHCSEDSKTLQECYVDAIMPNYFYYFFFETYYTFRLYNSAVGGIVCQGNATSNIECTSGEVKLVGGQIASEGRLEVCVDGFWGTVCDEGWDEEDALVVCRQLGLSPNANPVLGFGDSERRGLIISDLACTSRESNISQCGWSVGTRDCHHGRDVGIRCEDPLEYRVKLVLDSPEDEGPFRIGTTLTLQCLVDPPLPISEKITYTWTTSASTFPPQSSNSSWPNATLTIPAGHPSESQYYCHVYRQWHLLGVGSGSVQVQNLLYSIGNQVLQFTPTEPVTLKVNITSTDIHYNFRALTWFHNGMEVIPSERIVITEFNKTLTIFNTTDDDSGVYEVKFTGLLVHPYSKKCEQDVLALLRHYPIAIPAHFYLHTSIPDLVIQDTTEIAVEFGFEKNYLSIKASENISLTVRGKVHAFIDETVSTKWYFNGDTTLRPGATMGPLKRPLLSISQNMEIANTNHLDSGFYEVALTINTYTHLVSHLECPLQYNSFVVNTIGISDIVLARDTIQIVQSDSASVIEPTIQESTITSKTSNVSSAVGGALGGTIAVLLLSVITVTIVCIFWRKRRSRKSAGNTLPMPSLKKSPENPGNARYTSATDDVVLGPNISYEKVEYPGEIIYDKVN